MPTPRRRILRPPAPAVRPVPAVRPARLAKLRAAVAHERAAQVRWFSRLLRACRALEKRQRRLGRLEWRLRQLEEPACPPPSN